MKGINTSNNWLNSGILGTLLGLFLFISPAHAFAFNNGAVNFELVIGDSLGKPMTEKSVELLIELTTGSLDGQTQYSEMHTDTTDLQGVAAFAIGFGKPTDSKYFFDNFDVAQGNNYLRVSIKEASSWRLLLKSQIPNVPSIRKWLFAAEKSNTVIAIMIVVWLGIVVYLLLSGRKVKQLEKQLAALQQQRRQES